jgi:hypothetical protein
MQYWLAAVLVAPLVLAASCLFVWLNGDLDHVFLAAALALVWYLAVRAVSFEKTDSKGLLLKFIKPGSKGWLALLALVSLLILPALFTKDQIGILDKKGDMLMWTSEDSGGALGIDVLQLNCSRVLIPSLVAMRGLRVTVSDVENHHDLGPCHLITDKLAHVEIGGRVFTLDATSLRTITANDLLDGKEK